MDIFHANNWLSVDEKSITSHGDRKSWKILNKFDWRSRRNRETNRFNTTKVNEFRSDKAIGKNKILLNSISYKSHSHHYYKITHTYTRTYGALHACVLRYFFLLFFHEWIDLNCVCVLCSVFGNSEIKFSENMIFLPELWAWHTHTHTKDMSNSIQDIRLTVYLFLSFLSIHRNAASPTFWPGASLLYLFLLYGLRLHFQCYTEY